MGKIVKFQLDRKGIVTRSLGKIGIVAKAISSPAPGEEWEVEILQDTCPGERKGVLILNPIKRIENFQVSVKEGKPFLNKKSGDRVISSIPLEKKYIRSRDRSDNFLSVEHIFEPIVPEGVHVERPWTGWGISEFESPKLSDSEIVRIQKTLISAWRNGQAEIAMPVTYRHKYGEITLTWRGYNGPRDDLAILKAGMACWAEVNGVSFGSQNETQFVGGVRLTPHECGRATSSAEWIAWAEAIHKNIISKVPENPHRWIESTVEDEVARIEKNLAWLKEYAGQIALVYGDDVVPQTLGSLGNYKY